MKKKRTHALLLIVACGICAGAALASYRSSVTVENKISMGVVDISLKEYQEDSKETLVIYQNDKKILPGQEISKIPRITCLEAPCYIRANLTWETIAEANAEEIFSISEDDIFGMSGKWIKQGDYFYYTEILEQNESVDLFEGIVFPSGYTERTSGQQLLLDIEVDAIQAENFSPDFASADPWFGQQISRSLKTRNEKTVDERYQTESMQVYFKGQAKQLVSSADDFFEAFGEFMPGDTKSGSITVKNSTADIQDISFKMSIPKQGQDSYALLERISLTIKNDKEVIYKGTVAAASKAGTINLGRYLKGGQSRITFELKSDADMGNEYALSVGQINWTFLAASAEQDSEIPSNLQEGGTKGNSSQERSYVPVKTGDPLKSRGYILALTASIAVFLLAWKKKSREAEE